MRRGDCLLILEASVSSVYRRWEYKVLSLMIPWTFKFFYIYSVILLSTNPTEPGCQVLPVSTLGFGGVNGR